ncbi:MAG TPA: tetratricopeptide repeat protein [Candidatus Dormibacteraeota bacterium]|nr:tetratricopeptide repeat protein [Candidatus Dormibacteraeota bacterium]
MLGSNNRGRRKGIPIREGSVRRARQEANLSLAQVAGGIVSRTAIHLIEKGRSQPSMETLQQIAHQTHKPIEFFLLNPEVLPELTERRTLLRELERLTAIRDFSKVIDVAPPLLEKNWGDEDAALVHFYLGQAYCRLVLPREALQHLPIARDTFERIGDDWMAVDAMDWESSARGLTDDPLAIPLALEALDRCRRLDPKPPQTEARILGHIANMYVVANAWAKAIGTYEAAVTASSGVKDLLQLAKMHHGLGVAYQRMQQPAKARQHLDRALALYSIESDLSAVYRVENDLGCLLLVQGHLDSAEQHLRTALNGSTELQVDRRGRGHMLSSLGEVCLRRGQVQEARRYLAEAWDAGSAVGERLVLAQVHALLGEIEARESNPQLADEHFESAIRILEGLEMPDRLRDCHMNYAELLYARGNLASAALHWKSAAEIGKLASFGLEQGREAAVTADQQQ